MRDDKGNTIGSNTIGSVSHYSTSDTTEGHHESVAPRVQWARTELSATTNQSNGEERFTCNCITEPIRVRALRLNSSEDTPGSEVEELSTSKQIGLTNHNEETVGVDEEATGVDGMHQPAEMNSSETIPHLSKEKESQNAFCSRSRESH